jgi:NAD(P)-dependent dehydrogenase (short-subunit alcohol dehydrogenase family)
MKDRVCVITGGNGGIGRATALELARRGATVVLICRSRERGEAAQRAIQTETKNDAVELVIADLASLADVRRAAAEIVARHPKIHVLINNAAVFLPKREVTADGFEKTFATNYLSHFLLTHLLLGALKAGAPSRVINVATKTMGLKIDFDNLMLDKGYSILKAVGPTKLALILFTQKLAAELEGSGVTVNALHPGLVKTELLDDSPWLMRTVFGLISTTPEKGARTPVYLATADEVAGVTGKLFADCKPIAAKGQAQDPAAVDKLWQLSLQMTKLDARAS